MTGYLQLDFKFSAAIGLVRLASIEALRALFFDSNNNIPIGVMQGLSLMPNYFSPVPVLLSALNPAPTGSYNRLRVSVIAGDKVFGMLLRRVVCKSEELLRATRVFWW